MPSKGNRSFPWTSINLRILKEHGNHEFYKVYASNMIFCNSSTDRFIRFLFFFVDVKTDNCEKKKETKQILLWMSSFEVEIDMDRIVFVQFHFIYYFRIKIIQNPSFYN